MIVDWENFSDKVSVFINELANAKPLAFPPNEPDPIRKKLPEFKLACLFRYFFSVLFQIIQSYSSVIYTK